MAETVEIILTQDVKSLGKLGDRKNVKLGYARNYLFPQGIALMVNDHNLLRFASIEKKELARREKELAEAKTFIASLEGKELSIQAKTHDEGKLYGSVAETDLVKAIQDQLGIQIDKRHIVLPEHIRQVGAHTFDIQFHHGVSCQMKVTVSAQK